MNFDPALEVLLNRKRWWSTPAKRNEYSPVKVGCFRSAAGVVDVRFIRLFRRVSQRC